MRLSSLVHHKYLLKSTIWLTSYQIISVVLGLILSIVFARFTTKEVFGNYNFLISIISMLSIISIPGLNTSMLRSISRKKEGVFPKAVKLSFIWSLIGIPLLIFIGIYYYFFGQKIVGIGLFLAAIFFPLLYAPNNWSAFLQGKKRFDIFAKYSTVKTLLTTSAIIATIFIGKGNLILIFLIYLITNSVLNVFYYFKCHIFLDNNEEDDGWKKSGYKLSVSDFISISYDYMDKILIGLFLGPAQLAVYVIAVSIVSQIKASLIQVMKVIYPQIFQMNKDILIRTLKKIRNNFFLLSIAFVLIIMILLPYIITILYSNKYIDSIIYAQIYTITIPLAIFSTITSTILISLKKENILLKYQIICFVIMLGLYLTLIPSLKILGALVSSIIYYIILNLFQYAYITKPKVK